MSRPDSENQDCSRDSFQILFAARAIQWLLPKAISTTSELKVLLIEVTYFGSVL
jgi:hypothetical protein